MLVMNMAVAALFAASYGAIAVLNPGMRASLWFAASYAVGMLTPLAQLTLAYGGWVRLSAAAVYLSFAAALLLMLPGLAVFYRSPPPWRTVAAIAVGTVLLAPLLPLLPRNRLLYEFAYQASFTAAMAACVLVVLKYSPRRRSDLLLAGMLALVAVHFPIKALVAVRIGTGPTPSSYIDSTYALISQSSSGILLVATGLLLLVKALQRLIVENLAAAQTDPLCGIANRRGFEQQAAAMRARARGRNTALALLLLDLDHFKAVNDTHGHEVGDAALRAFSALLLRHAPSSALVARLGGEEFAVLLDAGDPQIARHHAETLRAATAAGAEPGLPRLTVSIGVSILGPAEALSDVYRRADNALYEAKATGRNRVVCSDQGGGLVAHEPLEDGINII